MSKLVGSCDGEGGTSVTVLCSFVLLLRGKTFCLTKREVGTPRFFGDVEKGDRIFGRKYEEVKRILSGEDYGDKRRN